MDTNENRQGTLRCIGKPNEEVKVYLEEKSDLFLKENMTDRVGHFQMYYLLGREYRLGRQTIYLIRGILEGEAGDSRQIHFTREQLASLKRRQERQFPKFSVLGWALNQPGYGNDGAWRFAKENEEFYAQAPILLMGDGLDGSMAFYRWQEGDYRDLGGYYVYSDQNPSDFRSAPSEPQRVDPVRETRYDDSPMPWELPLEEPPKRTVWGSAAERDQRERTISEMVSRERDLPVRKRETDRRNALKEKWTSRNRQESNPMRVLTSLCAVLLMVSLVMGMLLFNSVSTLDGIQSRLETMDTQIDQMYETLTMTEPGALPAQAPAVTTEDGTTGGDEGGQ